MVDEMPSHQIRLDTIRPILASLEEASNAFIGDPATKASGLLFRFRAGVTLLGLELAYEVFSVLENLNKSFPRTDIVVCGMLEVVRSSCRHTLAARP